jgi:hypothetical protein
MFNYTHLIMCCCSGLWHRLHILIQPWRWHVSPIRWYLPMSPHGIKTQRNNVDIFTGAKSANLTQSPWDLVLDLSMVWFQFPLSLRGTWGKLCFDFMMVPFWEDRKLSFIHWSLLILCDLCGFVEVNFKHVFEETECPYAPCNLYLEAWKVVSEVHWTEREEKGVIHLALRNSYLLFWAVQPRRTKKVSFAVQQMVWQSLKQKLVLSCTGNKVQSVVAGLFVASWLLNEAFDVVLLGCSSVQT